MLEMQLDAIVTDDFIEEAQKDVLDTIELIEHLENTTLDKERADLEDAAIKWQGCSTAFVLITVYQWKLGIQEDYIRRVNSHDLFIQRRLGFRT